MEETPICASVERDLEIRLDDLLVGAVDAPPQEGPADSAQPTSVVG